MKEIKHKTKQLTIKNKAGLHARATSVLVETCDKFRSKIFIERDDQKVNAKSILGIMTLGAPCGTKLNFSVEGPDADEAMDAIEKVVEDKFGEE